MSRNVEIKARAIDFERQVEIAVGLSRRPPETIDQEDTYFRVDRGRLKLRTFGGTDGELIQYLREDRTAPAESGFQRCPVPEAARLLHALEAALGVRGRVRKRRILVWVGRTRVHFDEVDGLGRFIELEVEMQPGEDTAAGVSVAGELMERLGITAGHLIEGSYIDLLDEASEMADRIESGGNG